MNVVNELLTQLNFNTELNSANLEGFTMFTSGRRKWLGNILPYELLQKTVKETIEMLTKLDYNELVFKTFPDNINSPDYGDKWGRLANYIEINNRAIAEMYENSCKNGILSSIKLLPAIPPSAKSWANCVIFSQIFPNIYGDGYNKAPYEENSIYGIKLNCGYSGNIIDYDIQLSPIQQFEALNNLAHFHGLKTGFRTVISADQIKVAGEHDTVFDWKNPEHQELFIEEHVKLVNSGFEAIFIDSAKHIGGYDMENYTGVGALPDYGQMQYILNEIRKRSGSTTLSFIGEKSTADFERYENLGLTTGTAFIEPDNYDDVKNSSKHFKYNKNYAPGVEVSNDNDTGGRSYEHRLQRINTVLFGYEFPSDKLASFMQMEDLFPLRYDTNTHHLMMTNPSYSTDGTPLSHWKNLFTTDDGRQYNNSVSELFSHALDL
ncbi:hypothetical protein IJV79_02540 [bacterium]|nr:hypothetical protein [bacterium]